MLDYNSAKQSLINDKLIGRKLDVTQEHIDCGIRKKSDRCAVALSLQQNINNSGFVSLSQDSISIGFQKVDSDWIMVRAKPSDELSNWISDFDMGKEVSPLELVLGTHVNHDEKDCFDVELNIV